MANNPSWVCTGKVDGSAILVDVANGLGSDLPIGVVLSANYVLADPQPIGFPARASHTGPHAGELHFPRTLMAGSRIYVLRAEADALVAAGAAELAP
jgi:hypothetical protein